MCLEGDDIGNEPLQPVAEAVFGSRDQTRHHEDDPLVPKAYAFYEGDRPMVTVRKVAAAPPTPCYKGTVVWLVIFVLHLMT